MYKYLPFILVSIVFLLIKISGFGIRLSDTNIYFYTAYLLTQGNFLYKDIFFTNFPLLPYVSVLYYYLFSGNLSLYTFSATGEVILVSFLIYLIVYKKHVSVFLSTISSAVYFFSFIVLSTSDHQSGVFLASLMGVIGYYFFEYKQYFSSGIFFGLSLLTKAYFLPLFLAGAMTLLIRKRERLGMFLLGGIIAACVILLPSLLFAAEDMYSNIVQYSLTRSQGISKLNILRFFVIHDMLLFFVFLYTIFKIQKHVFFGMLSFFGLVFIIFYKDIYYLYLNFITPFLAIAFSDLYLSFHKRFSIQKYIAPTILVVIFILNIYTYLSQFQSLQKLKNQDDIVNFLLIQPEMILYGTNDITPALAYLSDKKLLKNIVDTNENIYRKGYLHASLMTRDAVNQNSLLISKGVYYPQFNIYEPLTSEIFDKKFILKTCSVIQSYPIQTEGIENQLNIWRCRD